MVKQIQVTGAIKGVSFENNLLLAIRRHCLECMGGNKEDVEKCKACEGKPKCRLWYYRLGAFTTAERNQRRLLYIVNAHCRECVGPNEDVKNCKADGSNGFTKCNLFELRNLI